MLWDGESSDFEFADDEALYFRVQPENFFKHQGQLRINSAAIQLPDKSVNRSKGGGRAEFARHNAYPGCNGMCNAGITVGRWLELKQKMCVLACITNRRMSSFTRSRSMTL